MDKIIFLDIETDGKYKIIQISYIITCSKLKVLSSHNHFLNDGSDAIDYYKKAYEIFKNINDLSFILILNYNLNLFD